ncbi:Predicted Rossmann fold nucleotide-binding protein DprA/Smf involved in DNA uptake [Pseudomonas pohangensis]|uniref:Predicted Rossmann fold nucleotide-binding protein DprA/Smf involved in DNA uptake n=1 Tax=Pseudomonas pohangensis TaxID=364197 RepID=A0A1H2DVV1_9PSED|nr:DNA-processing protein DprA [Pseudomonas pohangensis]SDT86966.1 Predicted Rossmann fold nucleotide-binding protein DprA/Smf involved in DNA uptake [Pseudomonas pohangensis]
MSHQALSADTEVVLLLCGRFGGESQESFQPLAPGEYSKLAVWLNSRGLRPADMLTGVGRDQLKDLHEPKLEQARIEFLLQRGTAMALALERWSRGGLWVISRGDQDYPTRLRRHLKQAAPPLLYGAGHKSLLDSGGLAIIGSRDASHAALEFTRDIAAKCVREGMAVISGGARGVDSAAMQGATEADGVTIGVLASDLLKLSLNKQNRTGLQSGRLVLLSPFYPEASFNKGNAMGRNRYIYALSDQALVIDTALASGGTWAGAIENLKQNWVPLYVRTPGEGPGNAALAKKGAIPFEISPSDSESLTDFFARNPLYSKELADLGDVQQSLLSSINEAAMEDSAATPIKAEEAPVICKELEPTAELPEPESEKEIPSSVGAQEGSVIHDPSQDMFEYFLGRLSQLFVEESFTEEDISAQLGLEKSQAKAWLNKAADAGRILKQKKPVRYSLMRQASLLD